jgi:hypothetical protein
MIVPFKDLNFLTSILSVKALSVKEKKLASLWTGRGFIYSLLIKTKRDDKNDRDTFNIIYKEANIAPLPDKRRGLMSPEDRDTQSYLVEASFCKFLSPQLIDANINVAKIYFSDYTPNGGNLGIFMSDLTERFPTSGDYGIQNDTQLSAAVDWLAKFHAFNWEDNALFDDSNCNDSPPTAALWCEGSYWSLEKRMKELDVIKPKWKRLQRAASGLADLITNGTNGPRFKTVIHGDFKAANVMFNRAGDEICDRETPVECAVFDFQWVGGGYGAADLVMMIASAVDLPSSKAGRITKEKDILSEYHTKLLMYIDLYNQDGRNRNVEGYTLDKLHQHYDICLLDYLRFMAGWYIWGNSTYITERCTDLLDELDPEQTLSSDGYTDLLLTKYSSW